MFCRKKQSPSTFLSLKMHWKTQLCWHRVFFSLFEKFKWRRSMQFILLNTQLSYSRLYWTSYIYARKNLFHQLLYFFLKTSLDYHMSTIITRSWILTQGKSNRGWNIWDRQFFNISFWKLGASVFEKFWRLLRFLA